MNENRLEGLREEYDYKAKDVAKALNVATSTYSEWENNKTQIPTKRIIQLANYFNINIDYMLNISNQKTKITINSDIDLNEIGNHLKEVRKNLDLSLRELGNKTNSSFSSLASYERGEHLIQSDVLISICKMNNISIDWIVGRSKQKFIK